MIPDQDAAYRAVQTRDTRFDGQFFTAVHTTGIYCRPACPARTPLRHNVSFYPTSAAAQAAGYRACRRCLPDAAPGSPEWNLRADTVGAAMRLIVGVPATSILNTRATTMMLMSTMSAIVTALPWQNRPAWPSDASRCSTARSPVENHWVCHARQAASSKPCSAR